MSLTPTLAQARERAGEAKDKIRQGIDPVEERKAARAAPEAARRGGLTYAEVTVKCLAAKLDAFKNPKHRQQWQSILHTYAMPELGKMLVNEISVQDVLRVLEPFWQTKTEKASRLRERIKTVLSWAAVAGPRTGDNPAR
ncbi:phage integrase central domain-containing protein [Antarctobacter jejuensis]|uniref:phage integrase central domain-containing protein n=1 Tax=Antarctobacter jejuensis TaxID=1439938 RepID=UPI003FD5FFBA